MIRDYYSVNHVAVFVFLAFVEPKEHSSRLAGSRCERRTVGTRKFDWPEKVVAVLFRLNKCKKNKHSHMV